MKISSLAFSNKELIPRKYTCEGDNISPPLKIEDVPGKAKSLALIVDDPDAPSKIWVHWVVWNINPEIKEIKENDIPEGAMQGLNSSGSNKFIGPCPPSGTHRYFFKIYALDSMLDLDKSAGKEELIEVMKQRIIDRAELVGLYSKQ